MCFTRYRTLAECCRSMFTKTSYFTVFPVSRLFVGVLLLHSWSRFVQKLRILRGRGFWARVSPQAELCEFEEHMHIYYGFRALLPKQKKQRHHESRRTIRGTPESWFDEAAAAEDKADKREDEVGGWTQKQVEGWKRRRVRKRRHRQMRKKQTGTRRTGEWRRQMKMMKKTPLNNNNNKPPTCCEAFARLDLLNWKLIHAYDRLCSLQTWRSISFCMGWEHWQ